MATEHDEQAYDGGDHGERALVAAASTGDRAALDELWRRHGQAAWGLALAVAGDVDDAARALADGLATATTGLRTGRLDAGAPFRDHLLRATRDAAVDRVRTRTEPVVVDPAAEDPHGRPAVLLAAFQSLPERWRAVLWLTEVEGVAPGLAAPLVHLDPEATVTLARRAERGLLEQHVRTSLAVAPAAASCSRALTRLGAHVTGTLPAEDADRLARHLDLCEDCTARVAALRDATAALPTLVVPVPAEARSRAAVAWTAALGTAPTATAGTTGLSPRTEKVLAGVSAVAAAVGVLGAALFGLGADDGDEARLAATPISPLVDRIATPRPFDMSELAVPLTTSPRATAGPAGRAVDAMFDTVTASPETTTDGGGTTTVPAPGGPTTIADESPEAPGGPAPALPEALTPELQVELEVADTPIVVDLDEDPGVTVGPISLGDPDADDEQDDAVSVGGALEPLAPVVEPVADAVEAGVGTLGL